MSYGICHRMSKYVIFHILWHMPYEIKSHELRQYGYPKKHIDQTNGSKTIKIIRLEQIWRKWQKTEIPEFPLLFLVNSFVKWSF